MNERPLRPFPLWTLDVDMDRGRPGAITLLPHAKGPDGKVFPLLPMPFSMTCEQAQWLVDLLQKAIPDAQAMTGRGPQGLQ